MKRIRGGGDRGVACFSMIGGRPDNSSVLRRRALALQKRSGAKLDRTSLSTDVFVRAPSKLLRHQGCASFEFVISNISVVIFGGYTLSFGQG